MPRIRSISEIAGKWKEVTPRREGFYRAGVERPLRDWEERAKAQAGAWREGVEAAITEERFSKGVGFAGQEKWRRNTLIKGVQQGRWREGVAAFAEEYEKGFAPYRDVIEATELPERFAKGDERNIERVRVIAAALHAKKLEKFR